MIPGRQSLDNKEARWGGPGLREPSNGGWTASQLFRASATQIAYREAIAR